MRTLAGVVLITLVLAGCAAPPPPPAKALAPVDLTKENWYAPAVDQLVGLNREAENLLKTGKRDEASATITKGQTIAAKLLSASRPTLTAMEAASDSDELYGSMLLANHNLGWARMQFQKDQNRWKNWRPQTPESARRMKTAGDRIAECDRQLQ